MDDGGLSLKTEQQEGGGGGGRLTNDSDFSLSFHSLIFGGL